MAKEISGIAIFPRLSENDVFYWPQELKKFDGVTVPLRWNHDQSDAAIIGTATFEYSEENRQVLYHATVTNPAVQKEIDKGGYKVSIGASVAEDGQICHKDGTCVEAPVLDVPEELSIVAEPGIPESSLNILEKIKCNNFNCEVKPYIIQKDSENTSSNTSLKPNLGDNNIMKTDKTVEECDCKTSEQECPPGQKPDENGNCVPVETAQPKKEIECPDGQVDDGNGNCVPKPAEAAAATKDVTVNVNVPESKNNDLEKKVEDKIEKFMEEVRKEWQPKSQVTASVEEGADWEVQEAKIKAKDVVEKLMNEGHVRLVLNKEDWIKKHTKKRTTEAVSTSGTIPGVLQDTEIVIVPGANSFKPIRQYGQFAAVPTGKNTARFYTLDVAAFGAITESTSTDITASTHTFTAIDVTCSTRGWLQQVLKANLEDWPEAFLDKLKEVARLSAIKDEHNLIVQTLASTDNDYGGTTTAPYHISGTDGSAVAAATTEDTVGEFLREGIEYGRSLLEQQGHDPANEKFVAIISPRAWRTLESDTDLQRYVQFGDPSISKLGKMSEFLGVELIVSNELRQLNNSYRNVMLVSGKAFGLASQRDMELEMTKEIRGQFIDIVASHRIGVDEIDKTAYVIISSKQD